MAISEFFDAYSDDQLYLQQLEELLSADLAASSTPESRQYSIFCRLWSVVAIGGVECMIQEWAGDKTGLADVYAYFENGSNAERLARLQTAFARRNIPLEPERFEDLLAVKYIRNAYVHGSWNAKQKKYVIARGFPGNLMSFDRAHFYRMRDSYIHAMKCLALAKTHHDLNFKYAP